MRRIALLAALLAACAPKPIRPAPDVELVQATPIGAGHGLLIFKNPSPVVHPRYHLARHAVDGQLAWQRPLETRDIPEVNLPIRVLGGAALLPISTGSLVLSNSFLHVRLADGATTRWTPSRESGAAHLDSAVTGDARQIFVAWQQDDLEISAFDPTTGERQWSFVDDRKPRVLPRLRLTDDRLLFSDPTDEWQQLARDTGARHPLPVLDAQSTVCTAAGRQWARRDEDLLTMRSGELRSAVATFIPPAMRHQWTLLDCAATPDGDVILAVNIDPIETGMLVSVDPRTLAPRWDVKFAFPLSTRSADGTNAWPTVLGDVVFVDERGQTCAVARDPARILWFTDWYTAESWYHGQDIILAGYEPKYDDPEVVHLVRVRGSDGKVAAAVTLRGSTLRNHGIPRTSTVPGDHLWFALPESDLLHHGKLPLLVLDATTLQPVPPTPGRADMGPFVVDATPLLTTIFPKTKRPPTSEIDALHARELSPPSPRNPWDAIFLATEHLAVGLAARHDLRLDAARKAAELPADVEIRLLAWCDDRFVGVAEQHANDTTRWTLLKAQDSRGPPDVITRAYDRPLGATDLDSFLLLGDLGLVHSHIDPCRTRGSIDEAVWRSVTSEPRTNLWTLR